MAGRQVSFPALAVVVAAGVSAWVSAGWLTVSGADPGAPRLGLLPSPGWLAALLVTAIALTIRFRPSRPQVGILSLSGLTLLPWLPFRLPAAALIWTGHLCLWLWIGIAASSIVPPACRLAPSALLTFVREPRRAPWLAALVAAGAYLAAAWQVFPRLPGGDEPHYLVIAQSLLEDRDLKIENNHRQGGYRAYYDGELKPDYLRRGRDGQIYSIHAPGLPAIIAPAFALFGYPGVVVMLAIAGGCATAMAWMAAWRTTHNVAASWFGWATVALSVPFFFQSFMVFPDGPGAALVMAAVLASIAARDVAPHRLLATGAGLALLPWLHTRFALLAVALGVVTLARQIGTTHLVRRAALLLSVPIVSAAAWFWFFYAIYGTFNPAAPYGGYTQSALANLGRGVTGLLFDQQFGLLPNAPVYVCAGLGLVAMLRTAPRLLLELLLVIVPYSLAAAAYQMWWGGYSAPARFLVPTLLPLAIPAAVWFASATRSSRVLGLGALFASLLITGTLAAVRHGALIFNVRDGAARWLLWISPVVDLTVGLPSSFQNRPPVVLAHAAIWAVAVLVTAAIGAAVSSRGASRRAIAISISCAATLSGMVAVSVVWRTNRAAPLTPASGGIELLHHYAPDGGQIAVALPPVRRLPIARLPPAITLAAVAPATQPRNRPLIALPHPIAGTYEIEATVVGSEARRLVATTDHDFPPGWTWDLNGAAGLWRQTMTLRVPARELLVDADPATRRAIGQVSIRPIAVSSTREWPADAQPTHTTRYGPAVISLLSGRAYMEPGGTWIAGGRRADFAIAPDPPQAPIRLFVRNAPVDNQITLESGAWHERLALEPREERLIHVPFQTGDAGLLLHVSTARGARPAEFEPGSDDRRLLGCWIETR